MDAWVLANQFQQMQSADFQLEGYTGSIKVNDQCIVNRKPQWLKFQQGQIVPLS
jgi:uncharacterized protein